MRKMIVQVKKIRFRKPKESFVIFDGLVYKLDKHGNRKATKEQISCQGEFIALFEGDYFDVEAESYFSERYGESWKIYTHKRIFPGTLDEITKYLKAHRGIGAASAKTLVQAYGLETIQKIIDDPHALDIIRISEPVKIQLRDSLLPKDAFENLLVFLQTNDIAAAYATDLYRKYGSDAIHILKSNPYSPYWDHIWNFRTSEDLHYRLGYASNTPERKFAFIYEAIHWDSESGGNLFLPEDQLKPAMLEFWNSLKTSYLNNDFFSDDEIKDTLQELEANRQIIVDRMTVPASIYLTYNFSFENTISEQLQRLVQSPKYLFLQPADIDAFLDDFEIQNHQKLAPEQRNGVMMALTSPVSIITGGPGTGKTHTIRTIISCIQTLDPDTVIKVCAPTGKAAIRAEEMSGLPASTIHRMLRIYQNSAVEAEGLDCDVIIADEFSMVDAYLCSKLFTAISSSARLIIVGDYEQLPSVGPGLILRDLIQSKQVNTTCLKHIFRQSSQSKIISNAYAIINQSPTADIHLRISHKKNDDFYFIERNSIKEIRTGIRTAVRTLMKNYGYGINDIQILTPIKRPPLGSSSLNILFQDEFIPSSAPSVTAFEKEFRLGDKVIHTKNNSDLDVFNGEIGYVTAIVCAENHELTVSYPGGKDVEYSYNDLEQLDLAYALTVHKSQGSEFPVVIMPVHESILHGLNKNIFYTALTRAKKMVVLIGSKNAMSVGMRNTENIGERRSHLVGKIQSW